MSAQRDYILAALQRGPATVDQLREQTGIGQPGTRVAELRKAGHAIATIRVGSDQPAVYVLRGDPAC